MSGLVAAVVLLAPAGSATAADDPGPMEWPTIQQPDSGGTQSDPAPKQWTAVTPPENSGTASDPKPVQWPAPEQE